jgi:hypothetical protein
MLDGESWPVACPLVSPSSIYIHIYIYISIYLCVKAGFHTLWLLARWSHSVCRGREDDERHWLRLLLLIWPLSVMQLMTNILPPLLSLTAGERESARARKRERERELTPVSHCDCRGSEVDDIHSMTDIGYASSYSCVTLCLQRKRSQ